MADLGHLQQIIYRVLSHLPKRADAVRAELPLKWRLIFDNHIAARRELHNVRLSPPQTVALATAPGPPTLWLRLPMRPLLTWCPLNPSWHDLFGSPLLAAAWQGKDAARDFAGLEGGTPRWN